jgi:hypothetical protein
MKNQLLSLFVLFALAVPGFARETASTQTTTVTPKMVREAVQGWCDALLLISKTDMQGGDAKKVASQVLDSAYNYQDGNMTLFKPTLTSGAQTFRLTKQGALAYFVGGDKKYPNDTGFARKNWVKARFKPAGIIVDDDIGIFMGNVYLTDAKGKTTMVDKTFVFKFTNGKPRIIVHKSALPFTPPGKTS